MEHCRSSSGKQRSFDAPSVPLRLQVAKEQVQGEAFQNPKISQKCVDNKLKVSFIRIIIRIIIIIVIVIVIIIIIIIIFFFFFFIFIFIMLCAPFQGGGILYYDVLCISNEFCLTMLTKVHSRWSVPVMPWAGCSTSGKDPKWSLHGLSRNITELGTREGG